MEPDDQTSDENTMLLKPNLYQRFRNCMSMDTSQFKWVANMVILCFSIGEIVAFLLLQHSVKNLELPPSLPDILLILVSVAECLLAPFLGWFGSSRRRTVMVFAMLAASICTFAIFVAPQSQLNWGASDLCVPLLEYVPPPMMSTRSTIRLCVALLVGVTFTFARVVVWSNSIGYVAECDPDKLNMHFGIILIGRVLGLVSASGMRENVESSPWLAALTILIFLLPPAYRIYINPLDSPDIKEQDMQVRTGYMASYRRILSNKTLMMNAVSISLISAALWNFAYYEKDIVKTMYQIEPSDNILANFINMMYYHFWIFIIMLIGYLYTKPIISEYSDAAGLMMSNKMTAGMIVTFIVLMFVKNLSGCVFGNVGEHVGEYSTFNQPLCSGLCLCSSPLNVYSPVCVPEEMITYYSPCHAGCSNLTNFNGIEVLSSCSCGGASGRALPGACSHDACQHAHRLHQLLYLLVLAFGLVAIQMQGTSLVRVAQVRDKSMAMGVLLSLVALVAFVIVHAVFMQLRLMTCAWSQHGMCQLQTEKFIYSVGYTSVGLTSVSLMISIINFILVRRSNKETVI